MRKKYSFGFLFLDEIHHVNHFITIAVALSKEHDVDIITYPAPHEYLKNALQRLNGGEVTILQLKTNTFRRFTDALKKRKTPRKGFWMKHNRKRLLNDYDALVFTDYIHHKLKKYRGDALFPKFIKIPHGPAGRAYSYNKDLLDFDLHIIFGQYYKDKLAAHGLLGNRTTIAGYFKSDALKGQSLPTLFSEEKPIVIYNPHFDPEFTSWHKMGGAILEYFKNQDAYNLIFAPHINLFHKVGIQSDRSTIEPYKNAPHIHIDLGSVASVDMVYTTLANIYLGDVSSQAIEFILTPRPCIFINAHQVVYEGDHNYHFWKNGEVIASIEDLDKALHQATDVFPKYAEIQKIANNKNFEIKEGSSPTERGVAQILTLMNEN